MFLPTCLSDRSMRVDTKSGCAVSIISRTSNKYFHRVNIVEEAQSFLLSSCLASPPPSCQPTWAGSVLATQRKERIREKQECAV
jgi:hypothetical protein